MALKIKQEIRYVSADGVVLLKHSSTPRPVVIRVTSDIDVRLRKFVRIDGSYRRLSRIICEWFSPLPIGSAPGQYNVLHIDGDTLNCTPSNLKWQTKSEGRRLRNNGKRRGVCKVSSRNAWIASITVDGYVTGLGYFPYTPEGKEDAYKAYAKKYKSVYGVSPW